MNVAVSIFQCDFKHVLTHVEQLHSIHATHLNESLSTRFAANMIPLSGTSESEEFD